MNTDSLFAETKRLLKGSDLWARKGLGQHFLVDGEVLERIVSAARLTPDDIIIEVGPGLGILTKELAKKAGRVVAIELDDKLARLLNKTLASFVNITIINNDILNLDPQDVLEGLKDRPPASDSYKVVANLPYYIASAVLRHFFEALHKPQVMVVMVQKEVAEAITAKPGKMSLLSVSVQFYGEPKIIGYVPPESFYPAPEVSSAVLKIDIYPEPLVDVADEAGFFKVVRAGFTAPRKQIANSLAQGMGRDKGDILPLLNKAGITPQRRAETLGIEEWAELWRVFSLSEVCN